MEAGGHKFEASLGNIIAGQLPQNNNKKRFGVLTACVLAAGLTAVRGGWPWVSCPSFSLFMMLSSSKGCLKLCLLARVL
jgi:hypothetical protein